MKITLLLSLVLLFSCASNAKIYSFKHKRDITENELNHTLPAEAIFVLGEQHYDENILQKHADLIYTLSSLRRKQRRVTLGWEFLEYDNKNIEMAFEKFSKKEITEEELLKQWFPEAKDPMKNQPYLAMVKTLARFGGQIVSTNATRETKKELMNRGRRALAAQDQPSVWLEESAQYFERFKEAMGGHADPDTIKKYFLAQHYTDAIIAHKLVRKSRNRFMFLVIGSFHSDYNDGVVRALKAYPDKNVVSFKMVNSDKLSDEEIEELKTPHPTYGPIADFLVY